ncbi:hypothetical protein BC332_25411 [Capsicum chinense]|nr:hypothetical protein BC332_25411 [Capsicum chinense]
MDMVDGRKRLGTDISIQGNMHPATLFCPLPTLIDEIKRFIAQLYLKYACYPYEDEFSPSYYHRNDLALVIEMMTSSENVYETVLK